MVEENENVEVDTEETEKQEEQEEKTYTEEELEKLLQAETDRKTTKALETAKDNWEKEYQEKLEKEKQKAVEQASMTESEKAEARLEEERNEFLKQKEEFLKEKQKDSAEKELLKRNLPTNFTKYVLGEDEETTNKNIEELDSVWEEALNEAVTSKMGSFEPKKTNSISNTKVTKEELNAMNYSERNKFMEENPEEYDRLTK